jgi:hypothetical protein
MRDHVLDEIKYDPFRYYMRPCQVPKWFKRGLAEIGGRRANGHPNLRITWGPDTTWVYDGQKLPRYVVATDTIRLEKPVPDSAIGLVDVTYEPRYYGYPHWFVEEWRSVDKFVVSGNALEAEKDWERNRFASGLRTVASCEKRGKFNLWTASDGTRVLAPEGASSSDVFASGDPAELRELYDKFPEGGRYDFFMRINPAFAEPTDYWLGEIRRVWEARLSRLSPEEEAVALVQQQEARKQELRNQRIAANEERMRVSWDRLTMTSPRKGGTGSMAILPGVGKPKGKEERTA